LIKPYQQIHPNVTIKLQAPAAGSNVDRVLATEFAAGAGPDIYDQAGPSFMPQYIQNGERRPTWTPMPRNMAAPEALVFFSAIQSLPGQALLPATEFESLHLWYNKTLMQKYGWKLQPITNELLTVAPRLRTRG